MKKNGLYIEADGTQEWFKEGKRHRDDGPAFISFAGTQYWYKEGNPYEPSAHEMINWKMNENETKKINQ